MYLIEYQPPTALNRMRHRRKIRRMARMVIPPSYDRIVLLSALGVWAVFLLLFIGWWLA